MAAGRVPVATSALIGRADEVAASLAMLRDGSCRLVTLTGPPGVGKTRLALELAARMASQVTDGVAWVDLGQVQDCSQVPAELARGLGVEGGRQPRPVDAAVAALVDRDLLLVIDNYEHLLDAAAAVGELLEALPRLRVLTTSRQRLHLRAETEFAVPPLPTPPHSAGDDIAELGANSAVQLLLARAPAHVTLTARSARPLAEICRRMDGLPLAMELAAARLRVFTPGELSFRLAHRSVVLSGGPRDAPARHHTLSAAIEWSHALLPDAERTVFRRLSVLAGGWDIAAAQAVCAMPAPVVLAALESLVEHSLIRTTHSDGRAAFSMLTSIRDYASDQLDTSGEARATRARHGSHFARMGAAWEANLGTDSENATWAEFDEMHPDLAAAFMHDPGGQEQAWLAVALAWHDHVHGSLMHAGAVLDAVRALEDASSGMLRGLSDDAQVAVLTAGGVAGFGRGELAQADRDLRRAVRLSAASGDERRTAVAMSFLGHVARARGDAVEAAHCYRAARASCERRGSVRGTAWSAYDLGLLAVDSADAADRAHAEPLLREALTYFDDLGYDWAVAQSARGLATALLELGAIDEAGSLLGRSLVLHERVRDRRGSAQCLEALAAVAAARGSPAAAARLLGAAQTDRRLGATPPTGQELRHLERQDAEIVAVLGRVAADHEKHNGRTAPRAAVLSFAAGLAAPPTSATSATTATTATTLTSRQSQVAELIAAGRTNRQIGRTLGISEKTAESHVSAIMTRLQLPSRAGVAAWVAARSGSVQ